MEQFKWFLLKLAEGQPVAFGFTIPTTVLDKQDYIVQHNNQLQLYKNQPATILQSLFQSQKNAYSFYQADGINYR